MKNLYVTVVCFCLVGISLAQIPQQINYQAIVRDGAGKPVTTGPVAITVTITNASAQTFTETHNVTPNQFGLVNFLIGSINNLAIFNFYDTPVSIEVKNGVVSLGTQQLATVPFAFQAEAVNGVGISVAGGLQGQTMVYDLANQQLIPGNPKVSALVDTDSDTYVHVEKSADSDEIVFQTAGTQRMKITAGGQIGVGVTTPDTKADFHTVNLIRSAGGYFGNVHSSTPTFGIQHASLLLDDKQYALLQDKSGGVQINSFHSTLIPELRLQNNAVDQAIITNEGDLSGKFNSVLRLKGGVDSKFQPAGKLQFEHTVGGTPFISSEMLGTVGTNQDMGELTFSVMNSGTLKEAIKIDENTDVTINSLAAGGFVVADATGKLGIGSVSAESDPKVGSLSTGYLPKWNAASLGNSFLYQGANFVSLGGTASIGAANLVVNNPSASTGYMGVYLNTTDATTGKPFYGFAVNGVSQAWWYYDAATGALNYNKIGDKFTITSAGNVGVGVAVPSSKLSVFADGSKWDLATTEGDFSIANATGTYRFKVGVATSGGGAGDVYLGAQGGSNRMFLGAGTTASEFKTMAITGGNVGIGTITPTEKLTIAGGTSTRVLLDSYNSTTGSFALSSSKISLNSGTASGGDSNWDITSTVGGLVILDNPNLSGSVFFSKNGSAIAFLNGSVFSPYTNGGLTLGSPTYRWGTLYTTTNPSVSSDVRLKQNINSLSLGLEQILKLRPVSYEMKTNPGEEHLGFIAQEMKQVVPSVVGGSEEEMYSISYSELIPVLTKAIQEQQQQIEALKKEVEALKK